MKLFLLLVAIWSVYSEANAQHRKGEMCFRPNEHYVDCTGSSEVQDNCNEKRTLFPLVCQPGCVCNEDYIRSETFGPCIKPEECPVVKNQSFTAEPDGNEKRYLSNEECLENCKENCSANAEFKSCGTACPLTCDNYDNPPSNCSLECVVGCQCKPGFVKHSNGECVRIEECPLRTEQQSCTAKPDPGPCMAFIQKWYHDAPTGECKEFVYGGCGGNGNIYSSKEMCSENCKEQYCTGKPDPGKCFASIPKWYYDAETGECKEFDYGGCGGNGNRYSSEEMCSENCKDQACTAKPDPGLCRGSFSKWYYDAEAGECKEFTYGGCDGNANRYSYEDDCLENCKDQ